MQSHCIEEKNLNQNSKNIICIGLYTTWYWKCFVWECKINCAAFEMYYYFQLWYKSRLLVLFQNPNVFFRCKYKLCKKKSVRLLYTFFLKLFTDSDCGELKLGFFLSDDYLEIEIVSAKNLPNANSGYPGTNTLHIMIWLGLNHLLL